MKYLLGLNAFDSETDIISEAILDLASSVEDDKAFREERVRRNYSFDRNTVETMDALIEDRLARNECEVIDLAIERFATLNRMRESAAAISTPVEKEPKTSGIKSKKGKTALVA
jgi:hypothetical protein